MDSTASYGKLGLLQIGIAVVALRFAESVPAFLPPPGLPLPCLDEAGAFGMELCKTATMGARGVLI